MHGCRAGQDTLYGTVSSLRDPAYRRLWVSGLCSNMARWMDLVAVGWIALQMTGSPFMVAVAAFARSAPMMVLGPFAGIVADRVSRAYLLLVTQAGGAVIALAFFAMFAVDGAGYWPLVALEGAFGILWSLDFPARRTALFSMLGAARVAQDVRARGHRDQAGWFALRNVRTCRTASGILSFVSFHGKKVSSDFGASIADSMAGS